MLDTYAQWAGRLYSWRWHFAAATLAVVLTLLAVIIARAPSAFVIASALAGPLISISWGLLCLCMWFEPGRGYLQTGWFVTHLPAPLRFLVRWYFGLFLILWFLFGIVAWPLLAIWGTHWSNFRWSGP